MKIVCSVDQAECLRHGVDAPSSTVKIEVDPKSLSEELRNFVADELYEGLRFPRTPMCAICPPTYEGLIAAVKYGIEYDKWAKSDYKGLTDKELRETRQSLIKAAIKESKQTPAEAEPVRSQRKVLDSSHGVEDAVSGAIERALKSKSS
jgi:hypothetical protein